MSPYQIYLLSDEEKKEVASETITRITVHFDVTTKKTRIDVEFSDGDSHLLASVGDHHFPVGDDLGFVEN